VAWRSWVGEVMSGRWPELLNLYVHIPFCSHRCRYCVYYSLGDPPPCDVVAHLARLHAEIEFWASAVEGVRASTCYLGGGTPTFLDAVPLRSLLSHLRDAFPRKRGGEWCFECNPLTATEEKARLFEELDFNRVSFGVQSLRPEVLALANRGYQDLPAIERTFRMMQACRFCINVDLMYGLPGDTLEGAVASLERLLDLGPDHVTIYSLAAGTPWAEALETLKELPPVTALAEQMEPILQRAGYGQTRFGTAYTVSRLDSCPRDNRLLDESRIPEGGHMYNDMSNDAASLLGIGVSSRSVIPGHLRTRSLDSPVGDPFDPDAESLVSRPVTWREEKARFVTLQLDWTGHLDGSSYRGRFAEDLRVSFGGELDDLEYLGLIEPTKEGFRVVSPDPGVRFAVSAFFVEEDLVQSSGRKILEVAAGPHAFRLVLAPAGSGQELHHRAGAFGYYLLEADVQRGLRILEPLFARLFDRVVGCDGPSTLRELEQRLIERGDGLRLSTRSGRGLHGTSLRIVTCSESGR